MDRFERGGRVDAMSDGEELGRAQLAVSLAAPVGLARAAAVLGPGRRAWMGEPVGPDVRVPDGMERHLIDLQMRTSERSPILTFRKAAYLDVGPVEATETAVRVEVSWRAAGLAPLFPVFSGHVTWSNDSLALQGVYAPPGGSVGIIADRLLLNTAARGTARWLLQRIVDVMVASEPSAEPTVERP
jgi:hypothetical protein